MLSCCFILLAELQITVGHRSLADQNLLMSNEIPTVGGHDVWTIFYHKLLYSKGK